MWGWGGVVCCHLLDFNHIHVVFVCVCVWLKQHLLFTHKQAIWAELRMGGLHTMQGIQVLRLRRGRGGPGEGRGEGRGKGGEKGGVEDPLPRLHLQGWPLDPAVNWSVTSSCQPWESQGVNSGLRSQPILEV